MLNNIGVTNNSPLLSEEISENISPTENSLNNTAGSEITLELVKRYVNQYKLNTLPTLPKQKSPAGKWTEYQNKFITDEEIDSKFQNIANENVRMGVVCGVVSGSLEVIDFDNKTGKISDVFSEYLSLPKVKSVVDRCPVETTQSGGYHIYYRCNDISGNQKLASVIIGKDSKGKDKYEAIIETRGEGGFCVCAPSKGYKLIQGTFANIPVISNEERKILINAAKSFTQKILPAKKSFTENKKYEEKPWLMYDQSDSAISECKELLREKGWKLEFEKEGKEYWCRPGKQEGVSATFTERFFNVYSTNADPFEGDKSYFPSQIYTYLKYGTEPNDFKKSVKDFIRMGFGKITESKNSESDIEAVEEFISAEFDVRLNEVSSKLEWKKRVEESYREAEDYDISSIHRAIQHKGINFGYDKLNNLLNSDFVERFDPFREYFDSLPEWDGHDYIRELSNTVKLRTPSLNDYWYKGLRKYLIALTGCAIRPEITNETSIIFYGSQGEGKTKWLNRLVPDTLNPKQYLFVGNIYDDKDSKMNLATRLLINLDELGSFNRQEIGYLKSLFTLNTISLREPYMRKSKNFIRRASFVGSIDREEFLNDLSGTRRFMTFAVSEVDYEHKVDMDKVMAQAYALFKQGERFYFNKEEIKEINEHNDEFRVRSVEEELFQIYFEKPTIPSASEPMTTTEIANVLAMNDTSYKVSNASIKKLGEVLGLLGFEKKNVKRNGSSKKCWLVQKFPISNVLFRNAGHAGIISN